MNIFSALLGKSGATVTKQVAEQGANLAEQRAAEAADQAAQTAFQDLQRKILYPDQWIPSASASYDDILKGMDTAASLQKNFPAVATAAHVDNITYIHLQNEFQCTSLEKLAAKPLLEKAMYQDNRWAALPTSLEKDVTDNGAAVSSSRGLINKSTSAAFTNNKQVVTELPAQLSPTVTTEKLLRKQEILIYDKVAKATFPVGSLADLRSLANFTVKPH